MSDTSGSLGPSTDQHNAPVIDPTENVKALNAAANQRQDDLREADSRHVREIMTMRAAFDKELREAESARIDAIRQVDVTAALQQGRDAEARAAALAAQVTATAEAMRGQLAATANAAADALTSAITPLTAAVEQLRRAMYEAQGQKTQIVETQQRGLSASAWLGVVVTFLTIFVTIALATHGFTK